MINSNVYFLIVADSKTVTKHQPMSGEVIGDYPVDTSLRNPHTEKYMYEGGMHSPERYVIGPEEWTGLAGSYNLRVSFPVFVCNKS